MCVCNQSEEERAIIEGRDAKSIERMKKMKNGTPWYMLTGEESDSSDDW